MKESKFSLEAVPGSKDLNIKVTKKGSILCPQTLYFVLELAKVLTAGDLNEIEGGPREGNTNFFRSFRDHTRATCSISRARRNITRSKKKQTKKKQNVCRQTPDHPFSRLGPTRLRTSLPQGQDRVILKIN